MMNKYLLEAEDATRTQGNKYQIVKHANKPIIIISNYIIIATN